MFYLAFALLLTASALNAQPKRVLYLTHSAGFRHDSIDVSKRVLRDIAAGSGKLDIVSTEELSAISETSLREFDAVLFFTSGELALSLEQKNALLSFIRGGKGFAGVHSATDTLYNWAEYGDLIGGYFDGHPWVQEVRIDVEDAENPFVKHLGPSFRIVEEIYQFRAFSRERVRVLMTLDTNSVDLRAQGVNRTDGDFALAWTRSYGSGRMFYTALGHFDGTWLDTRFQTMMLNALLWVTGESQAESAPRHSVAAIGMVSTLPAGVDEALAPGSLFTLAGTGLTTGSSAWAAAVPLPTKLAGTSVLVNGTPTPLFEVSPSRVVGQMPYGPAGRAEMTVVTGNTDRSVARQILVPVATPQIVVTSGGGSVGYLILYATGLGAVEPTVPVGSPAPSQPLSIAGTPVTVRVENVPAQVFFAGLAPGLVGVYQINALWPSGIPSSQVRVTVEAGERISNPVVVQ
jgi:uncharacterized protein (TIGR03437 family)